MTTTASRKDLMKWATEVRASSCWNWGTATRAPWLLPHLPTFVCAPESHFSGWRPLLLGERHARDKPHAMVSTAPR